MDIRHLGYFIRLCKDKNMSVAAENLFISQQGLSKAIKRMETELGVTLYRRTRTGIEPTVSGKKVCAWAERMLAEFEELMGELPGNMKLHSGKLDVVMELGSMPLLTPQPFLRFIDDYPLIDLTFREHRDHICHGLMEDESAEVFLAISPIDTALYDFVPLFPLTSLLYIPADHELSYKKEVAIEDLEGVPIVSCGSRIYYSIQKEFENVGIAPNIVMSTTDIGATMQCVQARLGVAPYIQGINKQFACPDDVVYRPLLIKSKWDYCLCTKKGRELSAACQVFTSHLIEFFDKYGR